MMENKTIKLPDNISSLKDKKTKAFEKFISDAYSDDITSYDKIRYGLLKIRRNLYSKQKKMMNKITVQEQLTLCEFIYMTALQSKRSQLVDLPILIKRNKDKEIKDYDPDFGYEAPKYVQVRDKESGNLMMIEEL